MTTRATGTAAGRVLAWLETPAAKTVLARYGFVSARPAAR